MSRADLNSVRRKWRRQYVEAGVNPVFIDRALDVPNTGLWTPTVAELKANGVITHVSEGDDFAASGAGAQVTAEALGDELARHMPPLAMIREHQPAEYAVIVDGMVAGYAAGQTINQIVRAAGAGVATLFGRRKARADDGLAISYARLAIAYLESLNRRDPAFCYDYIGHGITPRIADAIPAALTTQLAALDRQLLVARPSAAPVATGDREERLRARVRARMGQRFPPDILRYLGQSPVPPARYGDYCRLMIGLYQEIVALRPEDAGLLLRGLHAQP